jgi:hypothetical protein
MNLRGASQAVGILDGVVRLEVRCSYAGTVKETEKVGGHGELARVGTQGVHPGIEGASTSKQRLDRHGARHVCRPGQATRLVGADDPPCQHPLGPIEKAKPLLGFQHERLQTMVGEHLGSRRHCVSVLQLAFADQGQGQMGEWSEVPGRPDRAPIGDDGQQVAVDEIDDALHYFGPHPRVALR